MVSRDLKLAMPLNHQICLIQDIDTQQIYQGTGSQGTFAYKFNNKCYLTPRAAKWHLKHLKKYKFNQDRNLIIRYFNLIENA